MTSEDDNSLGRWCLLALQVLAMALCLCIGARMIMEQAFELPHSMCVEAPPKAHPVTDFRSAE